MDNLNYCILLLFCHFIITGEAQAAAEDVGAYVGGGALNIGVCAAAAVAVGGDEGMGAVDGLHMHGLPDGAAFGIISGQGFQNLVGAALAGLMLPEVILLAADHGGHGVLVDDKAAQPIVGAAPLRVKGIHFHRQIGKAGLIALINRLFLGDMLIQIGNLAADYAGDDIVHTVVVADFLMLVPGRSLPALGGPFADLIGVGQAVGEEHAAGRAGDDLIAVEGNAVIVPQGAGLRPVAVQQILGAQGLGGVLHDKSVMGVTDSANLRHFAGGAIQMGHHHKADVGVQLKRLFQGFRAHVPGVGLGVDEDGLAVLIGHGVDGGVKGHVRAEDPVTLQRTLIGLGLAVQPLPCQLCGQVQSGGAAGQAHGVLDAHVCSQLLLHSVNIGTYGRDPVGADGLIHPALLVTVHGGRGQPKFVLQRSDTLKAGVR